MWGNIGRDVETACRTGTLHRRQRVRCDGETWEAWGPGPGAWIGVKIGDAEQHPSAFTDFFLQGDGELCGPKVGP